MGGGLIISFSLLTPFLFLQILPFIDGSIIDIMFTPTVKPRIDEMH